MLSPQELQRTPRRQRLALLHEVYARFLRLRSRWLVRKSKTSPLNEDFAENLVRHFHDAKKAAIARQHQRED